jgi:leucyl/phenylalanyl-tRNA--protein transferase
MEHEKTSSSGVDPTQLSPLSLIKAYGLGVFPMASGQDGEIQWYSPDPRGVLPLEKLHISKSLRRVVASGRYEIRTDTAFDETILACSDHRREGAWISQELIDAYGLLFRHGVAHSVEAWRDGRLVGGLYGVHLGGAFFGESMFSFGDDGGRDASKVCLVWLVEHLKGIGASLLDVQFVTDHLCRLGAVEISHAAYLQSLDLALCQECLWAPYE